MWTVAFTNRERMSMGRSYDLARDAFTNEICPECAEFFARELKIEVAGLVAK
jgi:hypothetical protein